MDKRFIVLPRLMFGQWLSGAEKGSLVVRCPRCRREVITRTFWTETGVVAGEPATLSFIECEDCGVRMYPGEGSFTARDPELRHLREEAARLGRQLAKWWRWTDKRTSKDRGLLKTEVKRKLQSLGLDKVQMALLVVKTMQQPHITADGKFHKPELYTKLDVKKLDALPDMLEKPLPFAPAVPTDHEAVESWRRQQGESADVHNCDEEQTGVVR